MTPISEPIERINDLFVQTAKAVVVAQKTLDEKISNAVSAGQPQAPEPFYSIPRTQIALRFGLDTFSGKRILIPFFTHKDATHEHHGHSLRFSLIGTPEPPQPPLMDQGVQIRALQPAFLLPSHEQDDLCRELAQALKDKDWEFAFPAHGVPPKQKQVDAEAEKILRDLTPENPERGMVVFKFDTIAPSYLVIRVTDKSKKDGIFVLSKNVSPRATIYSFDEDNVKNIRYAALHQFLLTLRRWLTGGAQPVPISKPLTSGDEPTDLGIDALQEFAERVYEGYANGLKFLSEQRHDEADKEIVPSFYDLAEVEGELSYSVYYDEQAQRLRFSFGSRIRPDGTAVSDEISVVESKAFIRAYRSSNNSPQVEVKLIAPEFALTDEARRIVLKALISAANQIADAFEDDLDRKTYLEFINGPAYQVGVVILLSYEGKTPKQNFLVAWPGAFRNQARDFVFTCKLKDGKIEDIKPILAVGQDIELSPIGGTIGVEITGDQYEPFHNAFHAVRIWRSRVEMPNKQ